MIESETTVRTLGISKRFPGVITNDHIDFELKKERYMPC